MSFDPAVWRAEAGRAGVPARHRLGLLQLRGWHAVVAGEGHSEPRAFGLAQPLDAGPQRRLLRLRRQSLRRSRPTPRVSGCRWSRGHEHRTAAAHRAPPERNLRGVSAVTATDQSSEPGINQCARPSDTETPQRPKPRTPPQPPSAPMPHCSARESRRGMPCRLCRRGRQPPPATLKGQATSRELPLGPGSGHQTLGAVPGG